MALGTLIPLAAQAQTQPIITTIVGGGPAQGTAVNIPFFGGWDVAVDGAGNMFVVNILTSQVYKIDSAGELTTPIGNGTNRLFSDLSIPAIDAPLFFPTSVNAEPGGTILVALLAGGVYRYDSASGVLTRVVGDGTFGISDGTDEGEWRSTRSSFFLTTFPWTRQETYSSPIVSNAG